MGGALLIAALLAADPDVERGVYFYAEADYRSCVEIIASALKRELPADEKARGRSFLVAGLYLLGERDRAREEARRLAEEDRDFRMDAALFPPEVVAFYDGVRTALPPPPPWKPPASAGWTALAAGAVAAGAAAALGALSWQAAGDWRGARTPEEWKAARDLSQGAGLGANLSWGAAVLLGGAGAVLIVQASF